MITIRNKLVIETLVFAETFEQEAYDQVKRLCNHDAYAREKIRAAITDTADIVDAIRPLYNFKAP